MAAASICVPRVSHTCLLHLQETLQEQQVGLTQAPIKLLLLSWSVVRFCVCSLSEISISPSPLGLPKLSPTAFQSQILWGLIFLVQDSWVGVFDVGLGPLTPVGEPLPLWLPTQACDLTIS